MHTAKPILDKIQTNQAQRDPVLDLREQNLREIPEEIHELTHLEELWLGKNAIQTLPSWLADLPQMQFIQLNQNSLRLRELGDVPNLVLDQGVWWRLQPHCH